MLNTLSGPTKSRIRERFMHEPLEQAKSAKIAAETPENLLQTLQMLVSALEI